MESALIGSLRDATPSLDDPFGTKKPDAKAAPGGRFAEIVADLVGEVNVKQNAATANVEGLARGEVGIMDAVLSLDEADLSLRMMMQLRDRALDAYQRILRTI